MVNTDMMVLNELYACHQTVYQREQGEMGGGGRYGLIHMGRYR